MVLFVATFLEAHVFVVASGAICTWPYHRGHFRAITNYTRFPHFREYRVTITLLTKELGFLVDLHCCRSASHNSTLTGLSLWTFSGKITSKDVRPDVSSRPHIHHAVRRRTASPPDGWLRRTAIRPTIARSDRRLEGGRPLRPSVGAGDRWSDDHPPEANCRMEWRTTYRPLDVIPSAGRLWGHRTRLDVWQTRTRDNPAS
jgi:hypothetical protein